MDVTASRHTDISAVTSPLRLFLAVRPARAVLAVTVLLGALAAWFGLIQTPIPTAIEDGRAIIPLWRMIAMGAGVLPVLALTSPLADLELVATQRLRSMQRHYLAGLSTGCVAIYLAICGTVLHPAVVAIIARAWIAWFGLALLAGAVLGWRLAWTLPAATAAVLWYWGYSGSQHYHWWEFSARPHDDLPSLFLSFALLAAGLVAYAATPWRRRRWIWQLSRPKPSPPTST
ncbi:hypothetical protein [Micromonospora sp. NPDC001898]|uniref:hypothetical protein n=1 Tax=Micromonospora sp. NPDC001898 TaxID=3364221 RepID=UPI0036AE2F81